MPSTSAAQQHMMGMAYAVKIGKKKLADLPRAVRAHIEDMMKGLSEAQLKDFATTQTSGLPTRASANRSRARRVRSA